jgi:catechol 2,3-dioxygenase
MVTRVGSVGLRVVDLETSVAFAIEVLGLREVERAGDTVYLSCNERHHELALIEGPEPGIDHTALQVGCAADLEHVRDRVSAGDFELLPNRENELGTQESFRFVGPDGHVFEIFHGMAHDQPATYAHIGVRPRKFGHVTLKTPDLYGVEAFLVDVLGMRLSDSVTAEGVGRVMAWYRCNNDHHGIGLVLGEASMHHYAFELEGWSSVGALADHLIAGGRQFLAGPGRHGAGNNLFTYFLDPSGAVVEYMADIDRIDDEAGFTPGVWTAEDSRAFNQWAPGMPPDFPDYVHPYVGVPTRV